jgi:hypothetical protein
MKTARMSEDTGRRLRKRKQNHNKNKKRKSIAISRALDVLGDKNH